MDEQGSYLEMLDDLDAEFDQIYASLSASRAEVAGIDSVQKQRLAVLIKKTDGRTQAVNSVEERIRQVSEEFFKKRRDDIASSRRNARMIQNHYRTIPSTLTEENRIFDSSN